VKTVFGLNVEKARRRTAQEQLPPQEALMRELKQLLPDDACVFAGVAAPEIVICHRGKALGLHLMGRDDRLSHGETSSFIALRQAGMRIEVARDTGQAKALVREMGVPLKEEERHSLRDVFRAQVRRR
jgi:hypothetical protein